MRFGRYVVYMFSVAFLTQAIFCAVISDSEHATCSRRRCCISTSGSRQSAAGRTGNVVLLFADGAGGSKLLVSWNLLHVDICRNNDTVTNVFGRIIRLICAGLTKTM